jgi:hypothetical protein
MQDDDRLRAARVPTSGSTSASEERNERLSFSFDTP